LRVAERRRDNPQIIELSAFQKIISVGTVPGKPGKGISGLKGPLIFIVIPVLPP
jgi:hypothetical protein